MGPLRAGAFVPLQTTLAEQKGRSVCNRLYFSSSSVSAVASLAQRVLQEEKGSPHDLMTRNIPFGRLAQSHDSLNGFTQTTLAYQNFSFACLQQLTTHSSHPKIWSAEGHSASAHFHFNRLMKEAQAMLWELYRSGDAQMSSIREFEQLGLKFPLHSIDLFVLFSHRIFLMEAYRQELLQAMAHCHCAIALWPHGADYYAQRALLHIHSNDLNAAGQDIAQALALQPNDEELQRLQQVYLGIIQEKREIERLFTPME